MGLEHIPGDCNQGQEDPDADESHEDEWGSLLVSGEDPLWESDSDVHGLRSIRVAVLFVVLPRGLVGESLVSFCDEGGEVGGSFGVGILVWVELEGELEVERIGKSGRCVGSRSAKRGESEDLPGDKPF